MSHRGLSDKRIRARLTNEAREGLQKENVLFEVHQAKWGIKAIRIGSAHISR